MDHQVQFFCLRSKVILSQGSCDMPPVTDIVSHSVKVFRQAKWYLFTRLPCEIPTCTGQIHFPATNRSHSSPAQGSTSGDSIYLSNPTHPSRLSSSPTSSFCDIPNPQPTTPLSSFHLCYPQKPAFSVPHITLPLNTI